MTPRDVPGVTAGLTSVNGDAPKSRVAGSGRPQAPFGGSKDPDAPAARRWALWLPALMGPPRKRTKTIAGVKYTARVRRPELPPSPNDRMHFRTKGPIVKAWREAARDAAKAAGIPPLARIRFSAVIRRARLGHADEDNDRGRCKALLDGLRDAGVIANDTRGYVEHGPVTEEKGPVGVLLIVEEAWR